MQQKTKEVRSLKKKLWVISTISFIVCAVMVGLMLGANEYSKENHTKKGNLVDPVGEPVKVATVESVTALLDMPKLDFKSLRTVKDLTFLIKGTTDVVFFKVAGFKRSSETKLLLSGTNCGTSVLIEGSTATYKVVGENDMEVDTSEAAAADRRLAAGNGPRQLMYNSIEEMVEARYSEEHRGRKLGFFSALMTSGSFTCMQAGSF
jgi:hypothetical protein